MLKQALQAFAVPGSLKWSWNEENQGTILEQNWTDLVQSHSVRTVKANVFFSICLHIQIKNTNCKEQSFYQ